MLERILDKYFAKKCIDFIMTKLRMISIDKVVKVTKNSYTILIKRKREKDEYYKLYMEVHFQEGLENLIFYMTNTLNYYERAENILGGENK